MYFPTIHSLPVAPRLGPQLDVEENISNIPELVLDSDTDSDTELPSWQDSRQEVPYITHAKTIRAGDILFGAIRRKDGNKKVRFSDEVTTFTYEADDEEEYYDSDLEERYLEPIGRSHRHPRAQHQSHPSQTWDPTGWANLGIPIPLDFYSGVLRFGPRSSRGGKRGRSFSASGFGSSSFVRSANSKVNYLPSQTPPTIPPRSSSLTPQFLLKPLAKSYQTFLPSISTFLSSNPLNLSSGFSTEIRPVNPQPVRAPNRQKVYQSLNIADLNEREWERRRAETALDFAARREPRLEDFGNYSHYGGKANQGRRAMLP